MTKPKTKDEIEAALSKLRGEYDYYCGMSLKALEAISNDNELEAYRRNDTRITAEYRSKIKALYWVLGQGKLY